MHARLSAKEAERHAKDSESRKKRAREKAIAAMQVLNDTFFNFLFLTNFRFFCTRTKLVIIEIICGEYEHS